MRNSRKANESVRSSCLLSQLFHGEDVVDDGVTPLGGDEIYGGETAAHFARNLAPNPNFLQLASLSY